LLHSWGLYYLQTGHAEFVLSKSELLWDLAQEVNAQKYMCLAQQLRGDALIKLTRFDDATIALNKAVQQAESISYKPVLWEAGRQLASVQPEKSQKLLAKARSLVRETTGQLSDPGLQQGFLESPTIQALFSAANNRT
jgi:hypothetical protein